MKVVTKQDTSGRLVYSSEILHDIVDCALGEVAGVVKFAENSKQAKEAIKIEQIGEEMHVDVFVKLLCTEEVSDVASRIQSTIKGTVENMTEFKVRDVNVHVIDVEVNDN